MRIIQAKQASAAADLAMWIIFFGLLFEEIGEE